MSYHFEFFTKKITPYIPNCIAYDLSGSEGCIHFDGHYYVKDSEFPQKLYMEVYHDLSGNQSSKCYNVEFYKREEVQDTSSYDDDIEEGRICYFPSMEQKLYFRVLTAFKSINELVDEIKYRNDNDW